MSLPTSKPGQPSIRSFFQRPGPKYAPPPSSQPGTSALTASPSPAPPPAASAASSPHSISAPPQSDAPSSSPRLELNNNLPPEATIRPVTDDDIPSLRRINALLLPVSYSDSFYRRAADPSTSGRFSRVITWAHSGEPAKVIGGVVCTLEPSAAGKTTSKNLYIQSLCLLSPYRSKGLATAAVDSVLASAAADPSLGVRTATAHVWTENEDGLKWYAAHGFRRQDPPIQGYYLKLRPDTAVVVCRDVSASAHLDTSNILAAVANGSAPPQSSHTSAHSFQNQRPETEWNDLPVDMAPGLLAPRLRNGSEPGSGTSSRSSSSARKKRDRSYPAAAFGNS